MGSKVHQLWAAFVGGGSFVFGVGITHFGLRYGGQKRLLDSCICEPQISPNDDIHLSEKFVKVHNAESISDTNDLLKRARSLIKKVKEESGSPGLAISVSVDGKIVWSEGFGYADLENDVPCTPNTVMRIASISKPLTATAAMKLLEEGKLNLDDPVQKYVPSFPEKQINSKPCQITIRHLLCHRSGIRHYHTKTNEEEENTIPTDKTKVDTKPKEKKANKRIYEFEKPEYYIKECYDSVQKSLSLFKDDPLVHEPGSEFLYTTFGWTLLSAVVESAAQKKFLPYMNKLFKEIGMASTQAELHENLVYGRARYYLRNRKGQLINAPYVDNCYKWAGGGFISTTEDLVKFGNVMLYASQVGDYQGKAKDSLLPGLSSLDNWVHDKLVEGIRQFYCLEKEYCLQRV